MICVVNVKMDNLENLTSFRTVFTLLSFCLGVSSSNILVVTPLASTSHFKVGEAITVGLANAGHNVTILSAYDYKPKNASNIESIQIIGAIEKSEELMKNLEVNGLNGLHKTSAALMVTMLLYHGRAVCNETLTNPNVKSLFDRKYDLVIVEIFATDSLIGLGQIFDAPVIGFSTFSTTRWTNDLIGNVSPLSYIPHSMLVFPDKMNFFDRMYNVVLYMYESIILEFIHHPFQRSVYNHVFPNATLSYDEARKNVALIFVNTHFSLARPLPYVRNIIEVGGMHLNREKSPLPKDIKDFIESATDGVIYFSFGSIVKSEKLPIEKRDAFINTFSKLKQKIIWKFENSTVKMPANVLTRNWWPQADILGHPNVKAFISHGGLLGSTEAVYHGVPIIAIPFFGDQRINMKRASQSGWAVMLDYDNITDISVEWAINEILQDKYLDNARLVSKRYRDQPMTPTETMVYWSEYVIRHKGAPHLRSSALDLNFIQYQNIDVFATLICLFIVFVRVFVWTIKKICCGSSKPKRKVERNERKKKR